MYLAESIPSQGEPPSSSIACQGLTTLEWTLSAIIRLEDSDQGFGSAPDPPSHTDDCPRLVLDSLMTVSALFNIQSTLDQLWMYCEGMC